MRPAVVAEAIAECHARFPQVPIIFAETRPLAQEWTYRFLAAAREEVGMVAPTEVALSEAAPIATPVSAARAGRRGGANRPAASTRAAEIRTWAREHGYAVSDRGRIAADVRRAYERDHPGPG